jgi:hypothetical protein
MKDRILEIEIESNGSYSVDNLFWKRLWTCHKTDNRNTHFTELNRDATGLKAQSYILLKREEEE